MPESFAVILNHLNLAVSDVRQAREFLVKHFGLDPEGKVGNDNIAFLRDDNGMVVTLERKKVSGTIRGIADSRGDLHKLGRTTSRAEKGVRNRS
jgi:catechol 2,3-dioxygenase-like lactoylglutathione lyase family enzyme